MVKHYAIGQNIQSGTIELNNCKVAKIIFDKPSDMGYSWTSEE